MQDAFVVPTQRIVSKFFGGENKGAWELGLRIGGFIQRAVEISGSPRVEVLITKSYAAGDDHLEYRVEWD